MLSVFLTAGLPLWAQKATFEVKGPEVVAVGEVFRIEFVANSSPKSFSAPSFGGLDVIAGPSTSTVRSSRVINGTLTREDQFSHIYILQANSEGEFSISEASVKIDGKEYKTAPFTVKAIMENAQQGIQSDATQQQAQQQRQNATIAPDDILLRVDVDKDRVYKGEPVRVAFKLYTRARIGGYESVKYPSFNGFWAQDLNDNHAPQREAYNNKIYDVYVLREYLLYPQQAGTLIIDPMEMTAVAQIIIERRRQSMLDEFFGGMPDIQEVRRRVASEPFNVTVRELPAGAPASFGGAVGEFQMDAQPFQQDFPANSAVTYTVRISGSGNLPQIQAPKMSLPASFEQYNVKTTESLNTSTGGISGYRQFEYPFIARVVGDYEVKPMEFTYFSPSRLEYITLSTPRTVMRVQPDNTPRSTTGNIVSGLSKEDIKILGRDIRFIKIGTAHLHPKGKFFVGSLGYVVTVAMLGGLFAFLLVFLRKYLEERRNSALLKGKRANKVALQRFKAAETYMNAENRTGFYEEMLKALWGYMSDKLNIPVANLTKENIREELIRKGAAPEVAERYVEIIGECEYAQYAPAASGRMSELYAAGVELISKLESVLGR